MSHVEHYKELGTYSNAPTTPMPTLEQLLDTARQLRAMPPAQEIPTLKSANFGAASVSLFWLMIRDIKATDTGGETVTVEVVGLVPDRDGKGLSEMHFSEKVQRLMWESPERRIVSLRSILLSWLKHELDEHLYLDSKRVFDPHDPFNSLVYGKFGL